MYKSLPEDLGSISGEITVSEARLEHYRNLITTPESITPLINAVIYKSVTEVLELIIGGALKLNASDIHIEPQPEAIRLRYRLDGVLHDVAFLPAPTYKFILSRIKLISGILLNIKERGQDGRFTIRASGNELEVRVSTLPGPDGENIVMRLLDPKTISLALEDLGMQPWVEERMRKELEKPNGMILTTGPTGSGKTTTLYAFIKKVYTPETKIITLENPIEYHLRGIEQTQIDVRRGYDFASGLRSILRQDPDVILVGEIRDLETAETALHAALTGHLVFSTLHTNDAAGTIPRLIDIGVKPNIIAPAINVAMAQRLVRRLCPVCRTPHEPTPDERAVIVQAIEDMPAGLPRPELSAISIFSANEKGCTACELGYKNRISVFEIILVDDELEKIIKTSPTVAEMREAMKRQGQITMKQDGVLKVLRGVTDLAEVRRVIG
ncbi:MAG: hypothetical protein A3I44_00935 [Candidatus Sungbacteria bacterium RIFCSPLOWO2_02_FULL_51_17]|uniref:Bacterial type II secretion system protein E domain-containing protein n=1 Tax=Candidatus Sungbacteria bacterium RIFCSPHIGHO2_02_FULL_51_29 TaxID=1802273 RepID=A0A1G2KZW6_9BACT|nr:MAG: hypothetical protein A2676_00045 [Candidatus Sungbacteria bacterium RIFCSPHIGHO2_01_FULL_51_22]OHA04052.1 MAG: hypothetical protein A3C16_04280 [Candidatus Sungbacteria bacterium RIFCSPHIGHO2_02_FULL_51_29]OHA06878.1 MAG: hypothetical protein A3B29_01610 [Candidatus Sungbacteria bacterium RIFCSPLOWO2_01_FULL_51_34]OHA10693.1 MAG: hypothetical protein A3I44_00935 [Candidatus Sungbacteria bacterium RIFCSPLOWO2_02_FULL_51_17]